MRNFIKYAGGIILSIALATCAVAPANAEMKKAEAYALLDGAIVELKKGTTFQCTAARVDMGTVFNPFLTARHCITRIPQDYRLDPGYGYFDVNMVALPTEFDDDWAVVFTMDDVEEDTPNALKLACNEEVYPGMPIAYAGYPYPFGRTFFSGEVVSVEDMKFKFPKSDIIISQSAHGGASGSPVISMDTGHVIGVLIEGIGNFVGIQEVKGTPLCPNENTTEEDGPAVSSSGT